MNDLSHIKVVLIDGPTASALSQVLPVLLLTLMVELRRTEVHRSSRIMAAPVIVGSFFVIFGLIETVLVLSIDGAFYPFIWMDLIAGFVIFGLLAILFTLSLMESPKRGRRDSAHEPAEDDDHL